MLKKYFIFFTFFLAVSCGGDMLDTSIRKNLQELTVSDVLSEPGTDSALLRFTTNIPAKSKIEYGTASGVYTQSTSYTSTSATSHSATLTSLANNTAYYGRAIADAGDIGIKSGDEFTFSTSSTITVSSLTATPASLTASDISWTTNVAATHVVEYGTVSGTYTVSTVQSGTAETAHSVTLTGLTSNTPYYYRVKNFHATLGNTTSTEQTFTITETAPTSSQKQRGIWLVGGLSGASISTTVTQIDLYDPVTNTMYSNIASAAGGTYIPVSFASITGLNGKIYVIGGFDSSGNVKNTVQIYDISGNSWTTGNSTGFSSRANIGSYCINGKIYVLGGTTGNAGAGFAVTTAGSNYVQIYNTGGNSWSTGIAVAAGSEKFGTAYNGIIYYMGGRTAAATVTNTHEGYLTENNALSGVTEVTFATAPLSSRTGHSVVVYNRAGYQPKMILIGGFTVLTTTTGNYVFQYTTGTTYTSVNTAAYLNYPFAAPAAWTSFANLYPLTNIGFTSAVISGDTLYVFGGAASHLSGGTTAGYKIDLTGLPGSSWSPTAAMQTARFGHGAVIAY